MDPLTHHSSARPCAPRMSRSTFFRLSGLAAVGLGAGALTQGATAAPASAAGLRVSQLGPVTGPDLTGRFQMAATDLGVSGVTPDGRMISVFGDTFRDAAVGSADWRSPVALYSDLVPNRAADHRVSWTSAVGGDYARQLTPYEHNDGFTILPADILTLGDTMHLWVMLNHGLGNVGSTEIYSSRDKGATWSVTKMFAADYLGHMSELVTWALNPDDGHVYLMTTKFDRQNALFMQRVPASAILDPGAYQTWGFRDGAWGWGNPPTPILEGKFGELCLRRLDDGAWVLTYLDLADLTIRLLHLDRGPLTDLTRATKHEVVRHGPWELDGTGGIISQPYGPYVLPGSTLGNIHMFVSQWHTGAAGGWPYRVRQVHVGGLA